MISEFFNNSDTRSLWFSENHRADGIIVLNKPPSTTLIKNDKNNTEGNPGHLYMLKLASAPVDPGMNML